jgi:restriction endonuclease Mrr
MKETILDMDIIYSDEKDDLSLAEVLRNGYTSVMSLFYVLFFLSGLSSIGYENIWIISYILLIWFPPIVLYLTPSFQNFFFNHEVFDKSKYNMQLIWNIILYPVLFMPVFGTIALLVVAAMPLKIKVEESYERVNAYRELEDNISSFEVSGGLESDKEALLQDIEDRKPIEDIEKEFELLKENRKTQFNEKIDNFIDKYGKGNPDQIEKLKKLISREENLNLDYQQVKEMIQSSYRERQRQEFKSKLNSYETETYEETLEAFVEEFGNGQEQTLEFLKDYTDREEVKSDVEDKFEEMRDERELERFKEELNSSDGARSLLEEIEDDHIDWQDIQRMNGLDFEDVVANLFNSKGYNARVTSGSGDQGADVVAEKDFEKVVIQAKRYKGKVSNSAVQEVVASMKHYNADRGLVITNSEFTSSARELASSNEIELWNGGKLKEQIETYLNKESI